MNVKYLIPKNNKKKIIPNYSDKSKQPSNIHNPSPDNCADICVDYGKKYVDKYSVLSEYVYTARESGKQKHGGKENERKNSTADHRNENADNWG